MDIKKHAGFNVNELEVKRNAGCLVVLSGGQDSVTCLGLAMSEYNRVHAVSFTYGQKHGVEIHCAINVCEKYGINHTIIDIPAFTTIGDSNLLAGKGSVNEKHSRLKSLPASFVPNRNAAMLTFAHALAQKLECEYVMTGVCQTDYSGYPDCREDFIHALELALNLGSEASVTILTPLMHIDKAETWRLSAKVGIINDVIKLSHTCYNGEHTTFHDWGYGCGECPACQLRAKGWDEYASQP